MPLPSAGTFWYPATLASKNFGPSNFRAKFRERSFLILGTRAEDFWQGYETFLHYFVGYENFKSNFHGVQNYFA